MASNDTTPLPAPDASCCSQLAAFEILTTCHEHILERLAVLEQVGDDLQKSEQIEDHHLARLGELLAFLDTVIPIHSADEEVSLFPRLRKLGPFVGAEHTPMDCMESEHVGHGEQKAQLKVAMVKRDAAKAGRCALTMVREYRTHIRKEEDILYPMARELLTDADEIATMTEEMRGRRVKAGLMGC